MRLVLALAIALVLAVLPSSPAANTPIDSGAPGPYAIGHTSLSLVDASRNMDSGFGGRPVPVSVWYPADAAAIDTSTPLAVYPLDPVSGRWPVTTSLDWEPFGLPRAYEGIAPSADRPFPIVLGSHGWGGRYYGLFFYAARLASHGFVVAVAQHFQDGGFAWETADPLDVALLNRPRDLSFMLDALLASNGDPANILFGSMRPDLVAASGHSLGGYAAMALAAGDDAVCATLNNPLPVSCNSIGSTPADARIKAIIPLDGSNQVLHFSELGRITVPSMALGQPWEHVDSWQARQHAAIAGRPSYRADIANAVHTSFTNGCATSRLLFSKGLIGQTQFNNNMNAAQCSTALPQPEVTRIAAQYAIAFLKTHLVREPGYQHMLTPGWALTMEPNVEFFVTEPKNAQPLGEDPCCFRYFLHQPGSETAHAERDPLLRPQITHLRDW